MAKAFEVGKNFKKVDNGIAGFWKPTKEGEGLQGVVGHTVETKGVDGRPNVFVMLRLTREDSGPIVTGNGRVVKSTVGMNVGVGGKMLLNFLSERTGHEVALVYRGLGDPKRGMNPPKLYDTYDSTEAG